MAEKYLIVSAQACARPNKNFLESIKRYRRGGAKLIILPMIGQNAKEDVDLLDRAFDKMDIEHGSRKLNENIGIDQFNVRPYQIDPATGLQRFTQRGTTKVFASPKQRLLPIAHSNRKHPKWLVTTGAVTHPNYATGRDVSAERRRLGNIAHRDHIYGALIVEIENDEVFHMRHVRSTRDGGEFVDLGRKYGPEGVGKSNLEALVLGDYHVGRTDDAVRLATHDMMYQLRPKRVVLHDFFDGHSVSHHIDNEFITQKIIQQFDVGHDSLEQELQECYDELVRLHDVSRGAELVVVLSNHH